MRTSYLLALVVIFPWVCSGQQQPSTACGDPAALIQRAAEHDEANDKKAHDYTYVEREDDTGELEEKGVHAHTYEVTYLYGREFRRLVAKDDKPLSEADAAKEEERIQKRIAKIQSESEKTKEEREKETAKRREEGRKFVEEISQAYTLTALPPEQLQGRSVCVINLEPRPGYKPHVKEAKFLSKLRGRVWIDPAEEQWVKLQAEVIDTISFGLFLARLNKGGSFTMEQTRINDEVWLPKQMQVQLVARIGLVKKYDFAETTTYSNYRKFRTDSRILPMSDPQPPPQ